MLLNNLQYCGMTRLFFFFKMCNNPLRVVVVCCKPSALHRSSEQQYLRYSWLPDLVRSLSQENVGSILDEHWRFFISRLTPGPSSTTFCVNYDEKSKQRIRFALSYRDESSKFNMVTWAILSYHDKRIQLTYLSCASSNYTIYIQSMGFNAKWAFTDTRQW